MHEYSLACLSAKANSLCQRMRTLQASMVLLYLPERTSLLPEHQAAAEGINGKHAHYACMHVTQVARRAWLMTNLRLHLWQILRKVSQAMSWTPGCVSCMNSNSLLTTVFRNFQWLRRKRGYWPTTYLRAAAAHMSAQASSGEQSFSV